MPPFKARTAPGFGYARVSSSTQDFEAQVERLRAAGCERVYAEKASGKSTNGRSELAKALKALQPGDTLVTVKLDRLARSIRDLFHILDQIKAAEAKFKPLDDARCDTTTPQGELFLTIMGGLSAFERKLIRQRCDEGIARAKAQGRQFGPPSRLDAGQKRKIAERYAKGERMADLAREYEVGEVTIWRAIKAPLEVSAAA